jgi:excisionase family DNA binding protein
VHDWVMQTVQHDAVVFEPTPEDRVAAEHVAERITVASMGSLAGGASKTVADPDGAVFEFVVQLATRAIADLAAGRTIAYTASPEAGVSPADAATLLGVSRQFVDRLIADGKLTHRYKPGSKHRIISITEINNLKAEREHGRNGVRRAIDALVDGGVEY